MGKQKPKIVKITQGTLRPCRESAQEPEPGDTDFETPPKFLNESAKRFWNKYAPRFINMGTLTEVDWPIFTMLCVSYGIYKDAYNTVFTDDDNKKRSMREYMEGKNSQTQPEFGAMNKAFDQFCKLYGEFGVGAASRGKIDLSSKDTETVDPIEKMLQEDNG